jgi:carbamoyltransferase
MIPRSPIYILGISCYYHDSAAVLLKDGEIVFAAQEERFTRKKHDESLPVHAIRRALEQEGIDIEDVDAIGFYEKPFLKFFDRILRTYFKTWPWGYRQYLIAMQEWMTKKLWLSHALKKELSYNGPLSYVQHHESHAASAFYTSGFKDATIVTVDGVGEWATTTIGYGRGKNVTLKKEIHYPHSLGLLYSAVTYYLGFKVNSAEYKVMGLAPYGEPKYLETMRRLIDVKDDGSFRLDMRYFTYEYGLTMAGATFEKLLGQPRRKPEGELTQFHKDVARSTQDLTNELMLKIVQHAKEVCPSENLCLAGGVALNCVANGHILRSGIFKDMFIQPAAGDAGGALGVALAVWKHMYDIHIPYTCPKMESVSLGTEYSNEEIESLLKEQGIPYETFDDTVLMQKTAELLEGENVIGWFQGRMEYGPRALGNRSILADARNKSNWTKVNMKIKFREDFRPFAPTILAERVSDYFDLDRESPFMLLVAPVHEHRRSEIPAVTHVDGSARIQTIRREQNPRYYDLLKAFEQRTGCPVIINTSFNIRGEPIVESPKDALRCFLHTQMDYLVMGNCVLRKDAMRGVSAGAQKEYLGAFEID